MELLRRIVGEIIMAKLILKALLNLMNFLLRKLRRL